MVASPLTEFLMIQYSVSVSSSTPQPTTEMTWLGMVSWANSAKMPPAQWGVTFLALALPLININKYDMVGEGALGNPAKMPPAQWGLTS